MRELKFRFYSKDAKQYCIPEIINFTGDFFMVRYLNQSHHIDKISQLEQFIGLQDKVGEVSHWEPSFEEFKETFPLEEE